MAQEISRICSNNTTNISNGAQILVNYQNDRPFISKYQIYNQFIENTKYSKSKGIYHQKQLKTSPNRGKQGLFHPFQPDLGRFKAKWWKIHFSPICHILADFSRIQLIYSDFNDFMAHLWAYENDAISSPIAHPRASYEPYYH